MDTPATLQEPFVSILILTHNAPDYVRKTLDSVHALTEGVPHEVVVVDNASEAETRQLVADYQKRGLIQQLHLNPVNSLFAAGNNIAATLASPYSSHFLLLNSDIEVRRPDWLANMLAVHQRGVTGLQIHEHPKRVDGWCFLIDADLYREHRLDESHQWWWAITKLQARLLVAGYQVQGVHHYQHLVIHFGGKSGAGFKNAKGMHVSSEESGSWFAGKTIAEVEIP